MAQISCYNTNTPTIPTGVVYDNSTILCGYVNIVKQNLVLFDLSLMDGPLAEFDTTGVDSIFFFVIGNVSYDYTSTTKYSISGPIQPKTTADGLYEDARSTHGTAVYNAVKALYKGTELDSGLANVEAYGKDCGVCMTCVGGGTGSTMDMQELILGDYVPLVPPKPKEKSITYVHEDHRDNFSVTPKSPIVIPVDGSVNVTCVVDAGYKFDGTPSISVNGKTINLVGDSATIKYADVNDGDVITFNVVVVKDTPPVKPRRKDFYTIYKPTDENMDTINNTIFLGSNGTVVDILQYFSSYRKFFVNIDANVSKPLKAGGYDFKVEAPVLYDKMVTYDCGSITVTEKYGNVLDYTPFSRLTMYLPFIGFVDGDLNMFMGHTVRLEYVVDVLSGRCLAQLYSDITTPETCFANYSGIISSDEVFGQGEFNYWGSYELMTTLQLGGLIPYVIISNKESLDSGVGDYLGLPSNQVLMVRDAVGFVKYKSIKVNGVNCTIEEKERIESLLLDGILVD